VGRKGHAESNVISHADRALPWATSIGLALVRIESSARSAPPILGITSQLRAGLDGRLHDGCSAFELCASVRHDPRFSTDGQPVAARSSHSRRASVAWTSLRL
jgi:hypothetical protein